MVQPVPTKAVLHPAKAAAMCTACHDYAHPHPPIPLFLLAQNLSSKRIVPTYGQSHKASSVVKWLIAEAIRRKNHRSVGLTLTTYYFHGT